jgi:DNA (cytosine-5)-methyltransferase 1
MLTYFPTPNTMDHLPARTAEQKEANKGKGGYANVRETVINDLLPTTRAQEPGSTSVGYGDSLNDFASRVTTGHAPKDLLRTPNAMDGDKGSYATATERLEQGRQVNLHNEINEIAALLPTTRTSMANGPTQKEIGQGNPKTCLETEVMLSEVSWGKFEPAIRRWEEVLGRPAPAPTKPDGKDGGHRLSSAFTEWMMGLPEGWITDCGLTRNEELKACGNGVVPQQAELALRILLDGVLIELEEAAER